MENQRREKAWQRERERGKVRERQRDKASVTKPFPDEKKIFRSLVVFLYSSLGNQKAKRLETKERDSKKPENR